MRLSSAIRTARAALLRHKFRSFLTSLAVLIGIGAVVAMVAAGEGARRKLDDRLKTVGKNLILIRPGGRTAEGMVADTAPLTLDDAEAIRRAVGPLVTGVAASQVVPQMAAATRWRSWPTGLVGSTPEVQRVRQWRVRYGRFFTENENRGEAPVCLIGTTVQQQLFPGDPQPVGKWLTIGRVRLRVIGVLEPKGHSPTGADQDDQIFMPLTTLQRRLIARPRIDLILTAARSDDVREQVEHRIVQVLTQRHHVVPGSEDFDVSSVHEIAQTGELFLGVMQTLVAVIASISLVVGGIGIMNIMLVSVTERTREIGIRMAVGARSADVRLQFLIESAALALAGGAIGVFLGIGIAAALATFGRWPLVISPPLVALAFLVAAGVGVFFGYFPARKASRLEPVEALRSE